LDVEKILHQLLVVVNFSENFRTRMEQVIRLANELGCDVHLLHVCKKNLKNRSGKLEHSRAALMEWQGKLASRMAKGRLLHSHSCLADPAKFIRQYVEMHHIDLVIMNQHRPFPWSKLLRKINIDSLARQLNCPVLNIPAETRDSGFKNIILPVTDSLPLRKIQFAAYLASYHNAQIHLLAAENCHYLNKTSQLLKEHTNLAITCHISKGLNMAANLMAYGQELKADLIMVQAGKESRLPGILNTIFSRFIFSASRIPVMAV
jgi:nucleotide-binding universal stress UspA family protein